MTPTIRITPDAFDAAAEAAAVGEGLGGRAGAVVTFSGLCRDEDGRLAALELEHFPGMAEAEARRVVDEAAGRWPLLAVTVVHRHGLVRPGEGIVLVVTAAAHRGPAFAAASFLMDFLKTRAPFWKREHRADGTRGDWVAASDDDARAAEHWRDDAEGC